jgi:transcriptional regulator with XRE-family HTH domain
MTASSKKKSVAVSKNGKHNIVGPSVRVLRMRKGWTQEYLSSRLKKAGWNCPRSKLAKIECGLIIVRDHDLLHLAKAFATRMEALYPDAHSPSNSTDAAASIGVHAR